MNYFDDVRHILPMATTNDKCERCHIRRNMKYYMYCNVHKRGACDLFVIDRFKTQQALCMMAMNTTPNLNQELYVDN